MKKVLIISFLIFTILINFVSTSYATVAVTGDKIYAFYQKLTDHSLTVKQGNFTVNFDFAEFTITPQDNKLLFIAPDNTCAFELNYTINNNKVSFAVTKTIPTNSVDNLEDGMSAVSCILSINFAITCAFLSIAEIQGTDLEVAYAYYNTKIQELTDNPKSITDDVFSYFLNTVDTSSEISLETSLEINLDNWSKVNSADSEGYTLTFKNLNGNNELANNAIENEKNIVEKDWIDTIKLSELKQNEIYKYTANSNAQFSKIENDLEKNCLLYIKDKDSDDYREEICMYKKISDSNLGMSLEFIAYTSGESFNIMYKEIENEELLKLIDENKIIYLSNYKDGDKLESQSQKYIYNNTQRNINVHIKNTTLGTENTKTTTIDKGEIYGFNLLFDSATISCSEDNTNNDNNNNNNNNNNVDTNTSPSPQEPIDKVTSSTDKLPQTGNFLNLQLLLILLIVICSIGIISNFKYKNINIK